MFKRSANVDQKLLNLDKRLLYVKNMNKVPLDVWAHWISNTSWFKNSVTFVIIFNALLLGLQTDMDETSDGYRTIEVIEYLSLVIFVLEILIKLRDDHVGFWKEGWNVFDFVVTALSLVPGLAMLLASSSEFQASV